MNTFNLLNTSEWLAV